MSETIELPVADAMTASDLELHQIEMERRIGPGAYVGLSFGHFPGKPAARAVIYPTGLLDGCPQYIHGVSWLTVIRDAYAWIATHAVVRRDTTIRTMALAIIDLTDTHTRCTAAMLERRGFSGDTIREFHVAACARAREMAGNTPFEVEFGEAVA